uniref:Radical SAM core domain-containing protein n=2 Tax=Planktothrix agardhii TaxID=1160 RepID=A0A1J1JKY7_PLAAG|nr:conserved protein of unknown function [Planktothrix agardhii]
MTNPTLLKPQKIDLSQFGPINLVVIQATSFCNLNCDYCYLPNRELKNTLSLDLIEPIFKNIFNSPFLGDEFTICWHAGEPLAVPISFYESAFQLIQEADQKYNQKQVKFWHSVQTNGTYINQKWCDFIQEHNICVGVSLDGPQFIHDAHRQTRKGTGSHAQTMRGISFLQKNDIPFYVISVVTQDSLNYADEIFNFFRDNGIYDVGFNLEEIEGVNQSSTLEAVGTSEKYRAFMQRFWELTSEVQGEFNLREFEAICGLIYSNSRLTQTDMNNPFVLINIDYQGNFSTFDPELLSVNIEPYGNFILGNVLKDSFESVCDTEKFQKIYADMQEGIKLCSETCEYFGVCGGGAGSNKYWENGTFACSETMACRYRIKVVTDIILDKLENSLGLIENCYSKRQ